MTEYERDHLSPADRDDICLALLFWCYKGHEVSGSGCRTNVQTEAHLWRVNRALDLAEKIGVRKQFLRLNLDHPLFSVTVKELED